MQNIKNETKRMTEEDKMKENGRRDQIERKKRMKKEEIRRKNAKKKQKLYKETKELKNCGVSQQKNGAQYPRDR